MKLCRCACVIALSVLPAAAVLAAEGERPVTGHEDRLVDDRRNGATARYWLELQRSRAQASLHPQPLSGEVQQKIHERYVKSFTHEVEERLNQESVGTSK